MYSGTDFAFHFNKLWGSSQSGVFSTAKLNEFFITAQVNYCTPLFKAYGLNSEVNEDATVYIKSFTAVPTNNELDTTETSTSLPLFRRIIDIKCKFILNDIVYYFAATELMADEKNNLLASGTVMYPRYDFTNIILTVYPDTEICLETKGRYFRIPIPIDTADATANLPFTKNNFDGIVLAALAVASKSNREDGYYTQTTNEIAKDAPA